MRDKAKEERTIEQSTYVKLCTEMVAALQKSSMPSCKSGMIKKRDFESDFYNLFDSQENFVLMTKPMSGSENEKERFFQDNTIMSN